MEPTCCHCKWFKQFDENMGLCRRFPPTVDVIPEGKPHSFYPEIECNNLVCGEFKGKITEG